MKLTIKTKIIYGLLVVLLAGAFIGLYGLNSINKIKQTTANITATEQSQAVLRQLEGIQQSSTTGFIIFILCYILLCIGITVIIINSIIKPLKSITEAAHNIADGNLSVNLPIAGDDEIGELTRSLNSITYTFKQMVGDVDKMIEMHHKIGDFEYFIDTKKYKGEYMEFMSNVNLVVKEYINGVLAVFGTVKSYADGDFDATLMQFPGKRAVANDIINAVSANLKNVQKTVMILTESVIKGELDKQADESLFAGDWKELIVGMNKLLTSVNVPLVEAQNALVLVSEGKLDVKISGNYKGQFKKMADSINQTIETLSLYINDISSNLNELASDNFNIEIRKDYIGNFAGIKVSLNAIIDRFNGFIYEMSKTSEQVATNANLISQTSMALSNGAIDQTNSVEKLNNTIDEIYSQITENSGNSTKACELSKLAKNDAESGNVKMTEMLKSMNEINDASQNISKIIKVIDDIAFQTNLLALNASVEAARAGTHGKGFAVVADEVGNLANKSKEAAMETSNLIEHTIRKINEGTTNANSTSEALSKIVDGIENVSSIITNIESSSRNQASSLKEINDVISHISKITQENSETSEKSATSAEKLGNQSTQLNEMVSKITLKR